MVGAIVITINNPSRK